MIFLLIWPFYHHALMEFSIDMLKRFTTVLLSIWSLSTLIPFANTGASNLIAFLMLYAIVILIRQKDIAFENQRQKFVCLTAIPYSLAVLSIIALDLIGKRVPAAAAYSCYFMRGNYRPVSMMVSVGLFMWGTTWKIKSNKIIDCLAEATFGVYLFHMYPSVMRLLFEDVFSLHNIIEKPYAIFYFFVVAVSIFGTGVLIDLIRKLLFSGCDVLISRIRAKNNSVSS